MNDTLFPSDPKKDSAFPVHPDIQIFARHAGLTQYAEVAARFHAAILTRSSPLEPRHREPALQAFDHADAFFAELAKRTKS